MSLFSLLLFIIISNFIFINMFNPLTYDVTMPIRNFTFVFIKIPSLSFLFVFFLILIERGFKLGRICIYIPYLISSLVCFSFYAIIFIPPFFPLIQWPDFFYSISHYFYNNLTFSLFLVIISSLGNFFLIEGLWNNKA